MKEELGHAMGKRDESVSGRFGFRFCKGVKREVR